MILVDLSNLLFRMIFGESDNADEMNMNLVRHLCFTKIRQVEKIFKNEKLVICFDEGSSWRFESHPGYKSHRRLKVQNERDIKAKEFFNLLKVELFNAVPHHIACFPRAEADDCMAVLSRYEGSHVVVSGDKDMVQLNSDKVKVFNPFLNEGKGAYVNPIDLSRVLFEHVMRGDPGDSIPNVKSPLNVFHSGKRQSPVAQKWLDQFYSSYVNGNYGELTARINENRRLICLDQIPLDISVGITQAFEADKLKLNKRRLNFVNYCLEHGLMKVLQ